jgi:hypothetical protein
VSAAHSRCTLRSITTAVLRVTIRYSDDGHSGLHFFDIDELWQFTTRHELTGSQCAGQYPLLIPSLGTSTAARRTVGLASKFQVSASAALGTSAAT